MNLNDEYLMILVAINKHKSYREIAKDIGRSLRTVQVRITELITEGYIESSDEQLARSRELTPLGKQTLREQNLA